MKNFYRVTKGLIGRFFYSYFFISFIFFTSVIASDLNKVNQIKINAQLKELDLNSGKKLFFANCNVCHISGKNLIIPEKNLKKETLEINGMNNFDAIVYQIVNGKNGMPAFGGRLQENEIEQISTYVLQQSKESF